ncbi:hypothetical protein H1R20_g16049, partial [Candolleomyces eurysporus]
MFLYQRNGLDWEWKIYSTQSSKKLRVRDSNLSCTDEFKFANPFYLDGYRIFLFDAPSFDNTNKSEVEILGIITSILEKQYRRGLTLHGIIYVHRIDLHVSSLAKTDFDIFCKLCGDSFLRNVVIMTNMWSRLPSELEGLRQATDLASLDDLFEPAIAKGTVMMYHMQDTEESAHEILRQILKNDPMPLSIQTEIVDQNKNITETSVGMAVYKNPVLLFRQKELTERLEVAEKARKEALVEAEQVRQLLEQLEEEKRNQTRQHQLLQEQLAQSERKCEQAMCEADEAKERGRRDAQAAEDRRQQEVQAVTQEGDERVRQLLEKWEEERGDHTRRYQLLQEQFAEAERKHEQAIRDAEERNRREAQAAEARRRQELEAAERRRAQEMADVEDIVKDRMKDRMMPPDFPGFRHGCIVSGRSYAMFNKEDNSYYVTVDEKTEHSEYSPLKLSMNAVERKL